MKITYLRAYGSTGLRQPSWLRQFTRRYFWRKMRTYWILLSFLFFVPLLAFGESFKMPTLDKSAPLSDAILPAPEVDFDRIFSLATRCGPTRSMWDSLDVSVQAGANLRDDTNTIVSDQYGGHYVGIVAKMPLFTGAEVIRQRKEEEDRRREIASDIQQFKAAIARWRLAQRMIGLYASLEKRSQILVEKGITSTAEQVAFLEKTAESWQNKITAKSEIEHYQLALIGRCIDGNKKDKLTDLLASFTGE